MQVHGPRRWIVPEQRAPVVVRTVPPDGWWAAARTLRDSGAGYLDMLTAAEAADGALDVIAHIVAAGGGAGTLRRHLLATVLPAGNWCVDSIADVFPGAAWHERELAEMFGVRVLGATDVRPLLLPESTAPLRKDAPLNARLETPWPGREEGSRRRPLGVPEESR
jgi:NADH-quinone oxidoreductase subunit C